MASILTQVPDGFVTNFSRALSASLKSQLGLRLADVGESDLAGGVENILRSVFPETTLSNARPDFESIMAQLMSTVEKEAPWADTDISATGQMLLRMISAVGAMNQFAVARAAKEAFHFTAWSDTSIMTSAKDLGNRLTRAQPASALINLTRPDSTSILQLPAYTQFQATDGINIFTMFNRDPIVFGDSVMTVQVRLYEGTVSSTTATGGGVPFETVEIGNETGNIADEDLLISVDGVAWKKAAKPLWQYGPTDKVFVESTLPNGDVEVLFGDNIYGMALPPGSRISLQWVETAGLSGNSSSTNVQISVKSAPTGLGTITGTLVTTLQNGMDALSANYFRLFASDRAASRDRMVRRADYSALAIGVYPGIYDARFLGQAELAPSKPSMMNIVKAVLLTAPVFTNSQWIDFEAYVRSKGIFQVKLVRQDPTPIVWNVTANIFCDQSANLATLGNQIAAAVRNAFDPAYRLQNANRDTTAGLLTLGFSWYMSDLSDLLMLKGTPSNELVSYVVPDPAMRDAICPDVLHYIQLGTLTLNLAYTRRSGYSGRLDGIGHTISYDASGVLMVD